MSGVYIKGMEMPGSCQYCRVGRRFGMAGGVECLVAPPDHLVAGYGDFPIPAWCPLIPVPDYGRLIVADPETFPTPHRKELNDYMRGWNACLRSVTQSALPKEQGGQE